MNHKISTEGSGAKKNEKWRHDLTFIGPCMANILSECNQQDATFLKFIYFCKTLYMFQTIFPSIIRGSKLHIQRQVFVRPLLLPAISLAGLAAGGSSMRIHNFATKGGTRQVKP